MALPSRGRFCYDRTMKRNITILTALLFLGAGFAAAQTKSAVVKLMIPGGVENLARQGVENLIAGTTRYTALGTFTAGVSELSNSIQRALVNGTSLPVISAMPEVLTAPMTYSQVLELNTYDYHHATKGWMRHIPGAGEDIVLGQKPFSSVYISQESVLKKYIDQYGADYIVPDKPTVVVQSEDFLHETLYPAAKEIPLRKQEVEVKVPNAKGGFDTYLRQTDGTLELQVP